jgi:hypothetical protein
MLYHKEALFSFSEAVTTLFQGANARLQDRIYSMQQKVTQQKEQSVDPDALRRRLEEVSQALRQYRVSFLFFDLQMKNR